MMLQDVRTKITYSMVKTRKPKMTCHRGRTWDQDRITLDGEDVYVWRDFTWGSFNYIEIDGQWFKFTIDATDFTGKEGFALVRRKEEK